MRSIAGWLGLFGWAASLVLSCDGSAGQLFTNEARLGPGGVGGFTGFAGRGGRGGAVGFAGRGGRGGAGGVAEEPDAAAGDGSGEVGAGEVDGACASDSECEDTSDCTLDRCESGRCTHAPFGAGAECGSDAADSCSAPDTCDGAGECSANDAPDDTACEDGSCRAGECIPGADPGDDGLGAGNPGTGNPGDVDDCPADVVAALPFDASWRTVGGVNLYDASCDANDTPDFAVVFTAPATAIYRFEAAGVVGNDDPETPGSEASVLADSVLAIVAGACAGLSARELDCNDDAQPNVVRDSRVDMALTAGTTVTVYAGEYSEIVPGGGSGTLRIRQLPN